MQKLKKIAPIKSALPQCFAPHLQSLTVIADFTESCGFFIAMIARFGCLAASWNLNSRMKEVLLRSVIRFAELAAEVSFSVIIRNCSISAIIDLSRSGKKPYRYFLMPIFLCV